MNPRRPNPASTRGAQSFVAVMGQVWRRPALTGLELAWRWAIGGALLLTTHFTLGTLLGSLGMDIVFNTSSTAKLPISVFDPISSAHDLHVLRALVLDPALPTLRWLLPLAWLLWNVIAAFGRATVLRRLNAPAPRAFSLLLLGLLRSACLFAVWTLWLKFALSVWTTDLLVPAQHNAELGLIAFFAKMIFGTLGLYVAWGIVSVPLHLAPLLSAQQSIGPLAALLASFRHPTRGAVLETNLVLHIVRIALIVLALVLSSTPLPFTSVATPEFLRFWYSLVLVLWLIASDYFHVVRMAAIRKIFSAAEQRTTAA